MLYITIRPGLICLWLKIRLSRGKFSAAAQSSHASTSADSITNMRGWVIRKGQQRKFAVFGPKKAISSNSPEGEQTKACKTPRKGPQSMREYTEYHTTYECGWGARIRTWGCRYQKPVPYRLATPHHASAALNDDLLAKGAHHTQTHRPPQPFDRYKSGAFKGLKNHPGCEELGQNLGGCTAFSIKNIKRHA